jgi:hypothetical protein
MVTKQKGRKQTTEAGVGWAADTRGNGVAYARIGGSAEHLLRVPFRVGRTAPAERAAGYAALTAVARALRARGVGRVRFGLDDPALLCDLTGRGSVPEGLVLPYVRLRCALNQFGEVAFQLAVPGDLAARARAEVALHVAA